MNKEQSILLIGFSVIDIIANVDVTSPDDDQEGAISLDFGGCTYNMSINIKKLGLNTSFLTTVNENSFNRLCIAELRKNNIYTHVSYNNAVTDPICTNIIREGKKDLSIRTRSNEHPSISINLFTELLNENSAIVLTCELQIEELNELCQQAFEKRIPSIIIGISTQQAIKLTKLTARPSFCFLTEDEISYIAENIYISNNWSIVANRLNTTVIVTMGKKGVAIVTPGGSEVLTTDSIAITGNTLGVNDLLISCIIFYHLYQGHRLRTAIELSFGHMDEIYSKSNANLGQEKSFTLNMQSMLNTAHNDQLTQCLNRYGLESAFDNLNHDRNTYYLILIDIDHFKSVNDDYGHTSGDVVLKEVALLIRNCMREADILARWGGEEFVGIVSALSIDNAIYLADRMRKHVEVAQINEIPRNITISCGVVEVEVNRSLKLTVDDADKHLYHAKETGRNKVCPEKNKEIVYELDLDL